MQVFTATDVGAAVRATRREKNLSQAQLADRVGVSREWVSRFERGRARAELQLVLDLLDAVGLQVALEPGEGDDA
ncbi:MULTISPECIES: helix-turn-helix transcriptional regulator [Mumia]|uniref:helix-turn-helix transcriptional regulator n=1 Tax=Mumia TaxID=1546255 RepID=UPI0014224374|nr:MULTISPECIES: helix-turn-helix domain-containing protein [unclassified Mumia]QMW66722.1 helix-turn-helix transcriptional regulator [Mumia sp. ZJ1417]